MRHTLGEDEREALIYSVCFLVSDSALRSRFCADAVAYGSHKKNE